MSNGIALTLAIAVATAAACSSVLTWFARELGLVDTPNERSSHTVPTPRGAGVAIVATSSAGFALAGWLGLLDLRLALALLIGGLAVAVAGFVDDKRGLSAKSRFTVHVVAAAWALYILDSVPLLQVGADVVELTGYWYPVIIVAIVWALNLFNFMDGIDGIAGSEATFVALAGGLLATSMGISTGIGLAASILAGSCIGFLIWNWPPARFFMGDVGSGYLGYVIAVLALAAATEHPVAIPVWLALGALFFVDATVTLVRRTLRGERPFEAHRVHAYQWLARRWHSHRKVTVALIVINVLVLLPVAVWCTMQPERAMYIVAGAAVLLGICAILAGAGRAEQPDTNE